MNSGERAIRRWFAALAFSLLVSAGVSGCAVVQISGEAGVRTEVYPGLLKVDIQSNEGEVSVVRIKGIGLVMTPHSSTLGWVQEWRTLIPDASRCRLVVIENTAEQSSSTLAELTRLGIELDKICVTKTGGEQ